LASAPFVNLFAPPFSLSEHLGTVLAVSVDQGWQGTVSVRKKKQA